ncbi:MAG: S8 family serine peptidase, partial [Bacteroidota bacterium]|nr:S8 family serine peptidase [Bacteroidota bacterium]
MFQSRSLSRVCKSVSVIIFLAVLCPKLMVAQQTKISDFALFGGSGGVELSSSTSVQGGSIGSFKDVKTSGNATLNSNIYSGGTIELYNNNVVSGNIAAANTNGSRGITLTAGYSTYIAGNVDAAGSIYIKGGKVSGQVTHPAGTRYSGPQPHGGEIKGDPSLPVLPSLPAITNFPAAGWNKISYSTVITPGAYGDIELRGRQTLTLSGTGVYIFKSVKNSGSQNKFVFDFANATTGSIKIYIYKDADFDELSVSLKNGGSASRIYTEVHGSGSTCSSRAAFSIESDESWRKTSIWLGTVWAPYGSINVNGARGSSSFYGALISATKIKIQSDVTINYEPLSDGGSIFPYYPPPANGKVTGQLGAELNSLYENSATLKDTARNIFIATEDSVMIEVIAKIGQVAQLTALLQGPGYGMTDLINNGPNSLIISGKFPIANLPHLDLRPDLIDYCRPLFPAISNIGITTTNGDSAIHSNFVRNGYGVSGQGVKVGVISDSYNTIPGNPAGTDVANGDLPGIGNPYSNTAPVEVLQDYPFGRRTDEGRAMLQIVHDIAPKAQLGFRTGFVSAGDFAQGIRQFQQNNYNVIVDDVTYITEPFFTDGTVAQAVNDVVSKGVSYFAAAGNYGNTSYQSTFNSVPAPPGITGTAHNFNNTGGTDIYQSVSLKPGTYTIVLQWQDDVYSLGQSVMGTVNDLDLYLVKPDGSSIGFNRNNIGGDPIEILPFTVTANTLADFMVVRASGNTAVNFKYVVFRGDLTINEYNTGQSTIVGQANAAGAMTVGAIRYNQTPAFGGTAPFNTETFSSSGGTPVNGVMRNKPDFTSPDGINTTVNFGSSDIEGDQFPNFFGTSAAAPHAAGVAALLIESQSKFSSHVIMPTEMKTLLQSTALDIGTPGFDLSSGAGLIQAQAALETFAAPTPVITSLDVPANTTPGTTPFTLTVSGNYFSDSTQVLFRGIPLATTVLSATQITASIPVFTG